MSYPFAVTTIAQLNEDAHQIASQYQRFFRDGSELQGYASPDPGVVVFYVTRGKLPFDDQGKASGHIARTAIADLGMETVSRPVMDFLIHLDSSDRLIMTPQNRPAPIVYRYNDVFEILI